MCLITKTDKGTKEKAAEEGKLKLNISVRMKLQHNQHNQKNKCIFGMKMKQRIFLSFANENDKRLHSDRNGMTGARILFF